MIIHQRIVGILRLLGWRVMTILSLISLMGCFYPPASPLVSQPLAVRNVPDLTTTVYAAADNMLNALQDYLDPYLPIIPASFVNMDDLESTSPLGRLLARQMASRFTQRGYAVTEVKLRKTLAMRQGKGEFLLSRNLADIQQKDLKSQAVLVGSYLVAHNTLFVTAQVIRTRDQVVLASQDFNLGLSSDLRAMLAAKP